MQFRGQYDVIIDCHNGIPFFTPVYVKEPVICVVHHIHQEVFKRLLPFPMSSFACFLERDLMPIVYRNKHFVTVSPSSKAEMAQFGLIGRGIEIVHNGVDLESFKPAEKSLAPTILYLGRLKAYKSIDVLITAFKVVSEKIPDVSLIIAGSGEEDAHLKRLTSQLNLNNRVFFKGKVSEEEKIKLLQRSWVMVNPSFMEGWGITTIEANACGTPVIGADVPGLRDSIRNFETGYLVPHGDTGGFADKIKLIVQDRRLRSEFMDQSLLWARNFSWDKSVSKLLAVIQLK
jgi:glycosyltransferase involved in cell wall biosynthesis